MGERKRGVEEGGWAGARRKIRNVLAETPPWIESALAERHRARVSRLSSVRRRGIKPKEKNKVKSQQVFLATHEEY